MSIQRYFLNEKDGVHFMDHDPNDGEWVRYKDHVNEIAKHKTRYCKDCKHDSGKFHDPIDCLLQGKVPATHSCKDWRAK